MLENIEPTRTVYCYYYPEVRKLISSLTNPYPHNVYLGSIKPGLDDFHEAAISQYISHMRNQAPGLDTFPFRYTSAGASESIFHILADIASYRKNTPLYVLQGEYEGYAGYGENLGLKFTIVSIEQDFSELAKGIFFISNPSAINGNILPDDLIKSIGDAGHEIIYDLTYLGLTKPHNFDLSHTAISTVIVSLSKPFGLYYYRIGFCFTRRERLTLKVNKWFKNIFTHILAEKLLKQFHSSELAEKYRPLQVKAVEMLREKYDLPIEASEVVLLAQISATNVPDDKKEAIQKFKRDNYYRFCLTPYFLAFEKNSA